MQQGTGGKIKSLLGQVCHQSNCFLNCILKIENKVTLNCMSTIVTKSFWDMKWKCCGLFLSWSACQHFSSLRIPQLKDGNLEFWEALETCAYICSWCFYWKRSWKISQCCNSYMVFESKVPGTHPLELYLVVSLQIPSKTGFRVLIFFFSFKKFTINL